MPFSTAPTPSCSRARPPPASTRYRWSRPWHGSSRKPRPMPSRIPSGVRWSLSATFTPDERVARQLQLVWGVRPFVAAFQVGSLDDIVQVVERQLLEARLVHPGQRIIILMGHPVRERPLTNLMRVHRI